MQLTGFSNREASYTTLSHNSFGVNMAYRSALYPNLNIFIILSIFVTLTALARGAGAIDYLTAGVSSQDDIQAAQRHQQQGNTQLAIQSYESVNIVRIGKYCMSTYM